MSKFKVSLKLQGLELEIEGSRDDIPLITANIGNQIAGLLHPATGIVEGEDPRNLGTSREIAATATMAESPRKTTRRRRASTATAGSPTGGSSTEQPLTWRHDPSKWGVPRQEWSAGDKILYLMHVAKAETSQSDLTAPAIGNAFNTLFRQSGLLNLRNMTRDLGRLKSRGGLVSDDPSQTPTVWFLTQNGEPAAQRLVEQALGRAPVTIGEKDEDREEGD
jgi:hypothetical protein